MAVPEVYLPVTIWLPSSLQNLLDAAVAVLDFYLTVQICISSSLQSLLDAAVAVLEFHIPLVAAAATRCSHGSVPR